MASGSSMLSGESAASCRSGRRALRMPPREAGRRMRALRRRVGDHDVQRWAASFLQALAEHHTTPASTSVAHAAEVDGAAS